MASASKHHILKTVVVTQVCSMFGSVVVQTSGVDDDDEGLILE